MSQTPLETIVSRVANWPGVDTVPHRFGGTEFRLSTRELGHLHEAGVLDVPLSPALRDQVLTDGLADRHHEDPTSPWVSYWVRSPADVGGAIRLARLSYVYATLVVDDATTTVVEPVDARTALARLGLSPEARLLVETADGGASSV